MQNEYKAVMNGEMSKEEFAARNVVTKRTLRLKAIDREQTRLEMVEVDKLIGPEHSARAIWEMAGELDLSEYNKKILAVKGVAGRERTNPRLLVSLWLYAYTQGVNSAREIERLCEYHPAYRWLCGLEGMSYHTLSSFRIANDLGLKGMFVEQLGILSREGFIDLKDVMHDGTKVLAYAGGSTFRREGTLEEHLEMAGKLVEGLTDPEHGEEVSKGMKAARKRVIDEGYERLKLAQKELPKIREGKEKAAAKAEARVSETDPEARVMKQGDGGYAPSYNVQITTDAKKKIIVAVAATQSASDAQELMPAVARVEENLGMKPEQMVVDAGFTTRGNIVAMDELKIEFVGSLTQTDRKRQTEAVYKGRGVMEGFRSEGFKYIEESNSLICPNEKVLVFKREERLDGATTYMYQARKKECEGCPYKPQCCPKSKRGREVLRTVEDESVKAFRAKMETEEAKKKYKQRSEVAEFPNLWIKAKHGMRRFRLRGLVKVGTEAMWSCLTYNIQQWIRLSWRPKMKLAAAAT